MAMLLMDTRYLFDRLYFFLDCVRSITLGLFDVFKIFQIMPWRQEKLEDCAVKGNNNFSGKQMASHFNLTLL